MAKNFKAVGTTIEIRGQATDVKAGSIYRRTGVSTNLARGWIGVVLVDIPGTSSAQTTIDGRPIMIGDGVAAEVVGGHGKGDMKIEGVWTFALPTSGMVVRDSDPVYMFGHTNFTNVSGTVASGVTNNQDAAFNRHAASGAFVGFAVGNNYTDTQAPYAGMNVVDVKLPGFPLQGLSLVAPSASVN